MNMNMNINRVLNPFDKCYFTYDKEKDVYICPNQKELPLSRHSKETRNGKTNYYKVYLGIGCANCSDVDKCTSSIDGRSIKRNIKEDEM